MSFSLIIPLFNEEKNIQFLINEFLNIKNLLKENFEIILINDCSTDKTLSVINSLKLDKSENIKIINNKKNLGQSWSLRIGINNAFYDTIVTIDGDGQNNPSDIPELLNIYTSMPDVYLVGGLRLKRKDTLVKRISSKIANKVRSFILKDDCIDTGCSLKVFDKNIFMALPFFDGIHRFLPALYKGFGKKTFFIPVDHRPRLYGNSNYGTMKRFYRGIIDIIRVIIIIKNKKND
ncbi:glycosyltransferase [Pelagibacteraceae bacterium]|nr:glycosyltransferase [Pelagibacteraceae bacterium]